MRHELEVTNGERRAVLIENAFDGITRVIIVELKTDKQMLEQLSTFRNQTMACNDSEASFAATHAVLHSTHCLDGWAGGRRHDHLERGTLVFYFDLMDNHTETVAVYASAPPQGDVVAVSPPIGAETSHAAPPLPPALHEWETGTFSAVQGRRARFNVANGGAGGECTTRESLALLEEADAVPPLPPQNLERKRRAVSRARPPAPAPPTDRVGGANLRLLGRLVVQFLPARDAVLALPAVCRDWAPLLRSIAFWRHFTTRLSLEEPLAGPVTLSDKCCSVVSWAEEFRSMIAGANKWTRTSTGGIDADGSFSVSVHARFRPLTVTTAPASRQAFRSVEGETRTRGKAPPPAPPAGAGRRRERSVVDRARRRAAAADGVLQTRKERAAMALARHAQRAQLAKARREGKVKQAEPWSREAPRFEDAAPEAEPEERPDIGEVESVLVDTHLWAMGRVSVNSSTSEQGVRQFDSFRRVLNPAHSQADVYDCVAAPLVRSAAAGYDCTLFAFGQTGSGKTHTMFGAPGCFATARREALGAARGTRGLRPGAIDEDWGIVPRVVNGLLRHAARDTTADYALTMSCVEVYQEACFDLFSVRDPVAVVDRDRDVLLARHARKKATAAGAYRPAGFECEGQVQVTIEDMRELLRLCAIIESTRVSGSTEMNTRSSRSHCVVQLELTQTHVTSGQTMKSKFLLVDLAGSERLKKSNSTGQRLDEAMHINSSLSTLGRCITALGKGKPHVPFRDSTLTRLLSQSLGGASRTALVVCCSQDPAHGDETINTLRFGECTALVQNTARRSAESVEEMIEDTRAALGEAERTLAHLLATGHAAQVNPSVGAWQRHMYEELITALPQEKGQLEQARYALAELVNAGRSRTSKAFRRALAAEAKAAARVQLTEERLRSMRRTHVYREADALYRATEAQVSSLRVQLAQLSATSRRRAEAVGAAAR